MKVFKIASIFKVDGTRHAQEGKQFRQAFCGLGHRESIGIPC